MNTSDFDYDLPESLIAQYPCDNRSDARMMVLDRRAGTFSHHAVRDLPRFLRSGDLLVSNDTRVTPARVYGHKADTGGKVEVLFLEEVDEGVWRALMHASRPAAPGTLLELADGHIRATVVERGAGDVLLRVEQPGDFVALLSDVGHVPLPPYIRRPDEPRDRERYQTVYARVAGAVAAPTAGLHLTDALLDQLKDSGVPHVSVTLHVGWGTFRPVKARRIEDHEVDSERGVVSLATADTINRARDAGGRVVAVGTTSVRLLETGAAQATGGRMTPYKGRTSLFIYPPFTFRAVDVVLTNFHLPCSSLLILVSAFAGRELILNAYAEAVRVGYRFYSYGDCMLIV